MPDLVHIRRALLSVSDKARLTDLASRLSALGVEIISTGGTAGALADAGIPVTPISDVTGFPEIMDGRVKTLHPAVHGGILARRDDPSHIAALDAHGFGPIDLVCINLYPFEDTIARQGVTEAEAIEQIDIGGPAMIRSAAKNFEHVAVVTAPDQYEALMAELDTNAGRVGRSLRARLCAQAFARTAAYDAAIAAYMGRQAVGEGEFPEVFVAAGRRSGELRYGENPHQAAAVYRAFASSGPSVVTARQLHGKQLSYNNLADAAAALRLAIDLLRAEPDRPGACVLKHTNPCGCAVAKRLDQAVASALAGDPVAAYGGIMAINRALDLDTARLLTSDVFLEVLVAPAFDDDALALLQERWKNLRLLAVGDLAAAAPALDFRSIPGGLLVQHPDVSVSDPASWTHAAGPAPTPDQLRAARFVESAARALTSNAIALGGPDGGSVRLFGAGAGQMDRVAACRIAVEKAGSLARGAIAASDAFFPFADGPAILADAGVSMILHPGGSKRDDDTFKLCEDRGVTCMTTGTRHFRH